MKMIKDFTGEEMWKMMKAPIYKDNKPWTDEERAKIEKLEELGDMNDVIPAYRKYCEKKNCSDEYKGRLRLGLGSGG